MFENQPANEMSPLSEPPRRSKVMSVLGLLILLCAAAAAFIVATDRTQQVVHLITGVEERAVGKPTNRAGQLDAEFSAVYQRFGMEPLSAALANKLAIKQQLDALRQEPCDKRVIYQLSLALEEARATRAAANMLKGFGTVCPEGSGETNRAGELYFMLGDYAASIEQISKVIELHPDGANAYYLRARALQGVKRYEEALQDYVSFFQLTPDTKKVVSEVFMRMSGSYEALARYCEAITPIQTFMSLEPETRATAALLQTMSSLNKKGDCGASYAKGTVRVPRTTGGVMLAKVEINGVTGTFVVDTGATFVTLSPAFAAKAKVGALAASDINLQTANGVVTAALGSAATLRLGSISANQVSVVVLRKPVGEGIDGLLGMSFLARFEVIMTAKELQLKAKDGV